MSACPISLGDVILITEKITQLVKTIRSAPQQFESTSGRLTRLSSNVERLTETIVQNEFPPEQHRLVSDQSNRCKATLSEAQELLSKCPSLGTANVEVKEVAKFALKYNKEFIAIDKKLAEASKELDSLRTELMFSSLENIKRLLHNILPQVKQRAPEAESQADVDDEKLIEEVNKELKKENVAPEAIKLHSDLIKDETLHAAKSAEPPTEAGVATPKEPSQYQSLEARIAAAQRVITDLLKVDPYVLPDHSLVDGVIQNAFALQDWREDGWLEPTEAINLCIEAAKKLPFVVGTSIIEGAIRSSDEDGHLDGEVSQAEYQAAIREILLAVQEQHRLHLGREKATWDMLAGSFLYQWRCDAMRFSPDTVSLPWFWKHESTPTGSQYVNIITKKTSSLPPAMMGSGVWTSGFPPMLSADSFTVMSSEVAGLCLRLLGNLQRKWYNRFQSMSKEHASEYKDAISKVRSAASKFAILRTLQATKRATGYGDRTSDLDAMVDQAHILGLLQDENHPLRVLHKVSLNCYNILSWIVNFTLRLTGMLPMVYVSSYPTAAWVLQADYFMSTLPSEPPDIEAWRNWFMARQADVIAEKSRIWDGMKESISACREWYNKNPLQEAAVSKALGILQSAPAGGNGSFVIRITATWLPGLPPPTIVGVHPAVGILTAPPVQPFVPVASLVLLFRVDNAQFVVSQGYGFIKPAMLLVTMDSTINLLLKYNDYAWNDHNVVARGSVPLRQLSPSAAYRAVPVLQLATQPGGVYTGVQIQISASFTCAASEMIPAPSCSALSPGYVESFDVSAVDRLRFYSGSPGKIVAHLHPDDIRPPDTTIPVVETAYEPWTCDDFSTAAGPTNPDTTTPVDREKAAKSTAETTVDALPPLASSLPILPAPPQPAAADQNPVTQAQVDPSSKTPEGSVPAPSAGIIQDPTSNEGVSTPVQTGMNGNAQDGDQVSPARAKSAAENVESAPEIRSEASADVSVPAPAPAPAPVLDPPQTTDGVQTGSTVVAAH